MLLAGVAAGCSSEQQPDFHLDTTPWPTEVSFAAAMYQSLGVMMQPGHTLERIDNGAVFDAIVEEIAGARTSIHVLAYIWTPGRASDRIAEALAARDPAVECRILVDAFGSSSFDDELREPLTRAGCEVRVFRPLPGSEAIARNHRKLVVADGKTAITGGFGIGDNWLGDGTREDEWRDTHVRFRGPAVAQAQQAFAENWQEAGGGLLPMHTFPPAAPVGPASAAFVTSTASPVVSRAERMTHLLLAAGKQRIWLSIAYFVPPEPMLEVLKRKADAGVDVRLLTAGVKSDSKTAFGSQQFDYDELTRHGVRVWEYRPTMMHAKTMVVDETIAVVGSQNLDPLSLHSLEEGSLVIDDATFNAGLAAAFLRDCELADEVAPD
ncbi:MAG: phosphatidylserine/phosphatidylglycerophosphate/cardiolipin synthase family protein [Nannocystis sp.]|nr:phosphatidylserine/phosphatidylglycerophosphate/cardiolipin synthase family protein [Nannocystis sp.]MBA3549455.1 phosphatidylserine/phosphatidylglycerophosphate/cardiolipin synthase family protein [Nannocystis sp.]